MLNFQNTDKIGKEFLPGHFGKESLKDTLNRFFSVSLLKQMTIDQTIILVLRLGVFGTFLGHGINAVLVKPNWIPLITAFGFTKEFAQQVMLYIGILDIAVALCAIIYPKRGIFFWAFFWAFLTALSRSISGEPIIEFIERASNWAVPLTLFIIKRNSYFN